MKTIIRRQTLLMMAAAGATVGCLAALPMTAQATPPVTSETVATSPVNTQPVETDEGIDQGTDDAGNMDAQWAADNCPACGMG